jgi:hypothetical protein
MLKIAGETAWRIRLRHHLATSQNQQLAKHGGTGFQVAKQMLKYVQRGCNPRVQMQSDRGKM